MTLSHYYGQATEIISLLVFAAVLYSLLLIALRLLHWRRLVKRDTICYELTPPAHTARTPQATQEFMNIIHGFNDARTFKDKLMHRRVTLSLQTISTRENGIRYIAHLDTSMAASFSKAVTAYLPEVKVKQVSVALSSEDMQVIEFKLRGHYAFPLAAGRSLEDHDPIGYLTSTMTNLAQGEHMSFQMLVTPVRLRESSIILHKILSNEDLLTQLRGHKWPLVSGCFSFMTKALFAATDAVGTIYHGSNSSSFRSADRSTYERLQIAKRERPARTLSAFELELMESIHRKVSQPLFRVTIRAAIQTDNPATMRERLGAIKSSLQSYTVPSYQALQPRMRLPFTSVLRRYAFLHQLPALFNRHAMILSSSEIASLYHFPLGHTNKTDNLITSLSRTLAAPVSLKQNKELAVVIGQNEHHGMSTLIGLNEQERERHVYIIGGTGNGKTTMLQYGIVQDMQNGKGVAVVDPHGDMAETLLNYVPKDRIDDVIYLNPDDIKHPIGLNLLELPKGLDANELMREKDLITEAVISVFRKIFSDEDTGGHRIEYILRNTIQTALTVEGATLFTVYDLLNDPKYCAQVVSQLDNQDLINFWKYEMGKAGDMQRVKMAVGITAKIGRFLFSASAKRILEQPVSTINFNDIVNTGKILICNFSKGLLGEDTSALFGITVLAQLQLASLRRARIAQAERQPFYLYVDEFQNFATPSFVQMLSESRKYKLYLTMAEQSTSQQKDQQTVQIILANVGTVICFRTGNPADEQLLLPLFAPYIDQGEIANLNPYTFYARLAATTAQEPLSGTTLLLPDISDETIKARVIVCSRHQYARSRPATQKKPVIKRRRIQKASAQSSRNAFS